MWKSYASWWKVFKVLRRQDTSVPEWSDTWTYVGSEGYIVWDGRVCFPTWRSINEPKRFTFVTVLFYKAQMCQIKWWECRFQPTEHPSSHSPPLWLLKRQKNQKVPTLSVFCSSILSYRGNMVDPSWWGGPSPRTLHQIWTQRWRRSPVHPYTELPVWRPANSLFWTFRMFLDRVAPVTTLKWVFSRMLWRSKKDDPPFYSHGFHFQKNSDSLFQLITQD